MTEYNELGKLLSRARKAKNYRQRDVAKFVGKSVAYICDIEKGVRGTKGANHLMLIKWAEFLQLPITLVLTKAGHEFDENSERFKAFSRVTRNKIKTKRMIDSIDTIRELLRELERNTAGDAPLRKIVKSLAETVKELESSIMYAG